MNDQFIKANPQNTYNKYLLKKLFKKDLRIILTVNTMDNRHQNAKNTAKKRATYN